MEDNNNNNNNNNINNNNNNNNNKVNIRKWAYIQKSYRTLDKSNKHTNSYHAIVL